MMFTFVHSYSDEVKVQLVADRYCPAKYIYIMPDNNAPDFIEIARDRYAIEKDRNEWIRKYDRLLKGLHYWRCKAMENINEL